jgi:hypothetical protein
MKSIYLLLIYLNIAYSFFHYPLYLKKNNRKTNLNLQNNNETNYLNYTKLFTNFLSNSYLNNLPVKKNNILGKNLSTNNDYLTELNNKYKLKIEDTIKSRVNIIKKISFDDLILFNNYIDAIYYYNNSKKNIIIEFKNNTRKVYYYNDNDFYSIQRIIQITKNDIEMINLNDYPYYIINNPYAFLICEKK